MNSMKLEKRMTNSKFSANKNFLYFLIAPLVIILVGAILLCTCGYNLGYDFTGGTTFRMFVNKNDEIIQTTDKYDLEVAKDYDEVYNKIIKIVTENGGNVASYTKTGMSILEYNVVDGQAIEVTYQNSSTDKTKIETQNESIRNAIIETFGLAEFDKAVSEFDIVGQKASSSWATALICSAILAFVAGVIYVMARYNISASLVGIIMLAFDMFMMLSLALICRLPINMTFGGVILATTLASLINLFSFYHKFNEGKKAGKFVKMSNGEIADSVVNSQSFIKTMIYVVLAIIMLVLVAVSVDGVRFTALGMIFMLIATYYNSQFILPSLFTVLYRKRSKKNRKIS